MDRVTGAGCGGTGAVADDADRGQGPCGGADHRGQEQPENRIEDAGGLLPSPSALIVLLASITLGRKVFGGVLVVAYGLGMAFTLTVAGLLLVRLGLALRGLLLGA